MEPTRPPPSRPPALVLPPHLERVGLLERGGMGEVWRVVDRRLGREMALKVGHPATLRDAPLRRRFENEARITARLDHPGVVPVHEAGLLPDGRPYFTMRTVRGETLAGVLAAGRTPLSRSVEHLERVCLIVAYAHVQGVVHADLKPANVIVGAFGEVLVLDWGIARRVEDPYDGEVVGTPGFVAPELQAGGAPTPASDTYALGRTLLEVVTGASGSEAEALAVLARRALSVSPEARPTAAELASELAAWRDRSRRRAAAERLLAEASPLAAAAAARRAEAEEAARAAEALLGALPPDAPPAARQPGWAQAEAAEEARTEAEILEARFVEGLQAALREEDGLGAARDRLADHHRARLLAAEERGDFAGAARERVSFLAHARGARRSWLEAPARVWLDAAGGPAEVRAWRYVRRFGRLEAVPAGVVGTTPLRGLDLEAGSWRLDLVAAGEEGAGAAPREGGLPAAREARGARASVPVALGRAEELDLGAVTLLSDLGDEDCYVPAGWAWVGGDGDAPDAAPGRRLWVDGFVLRRHPVTVAEYLAFLDDLVRRGEERRALALQPVQIDGRGAEGVPVFRRRADGRFEAGASADGLPWALDWPVVLVSWAAAAAFAAWEAERTGRPWRLPDEWEWEKAARGVDRRRYPWGTRMDPSWACMQLSHADRPARVAVTAFPVDESPYGVRGLGGNVRDWCLNSFGRGPPGERVSPGAGGGDERFRMVRGGAWNSAPAYCLAAARFASAPGRTATNVGIRLARGVGISVGTCTTSPC